MNWIQYSVYLIYIDCYYEVYVWEGNNSSKAERDMAHQVAKRYVEKAKVNQLQIHFRNTK